MAIIGWIFFGLIVGVVAKFLMPGRDTGGFVVTIVIGISGALIGGFIGQSFGLWHRRTHRFCDGCRRLDCSLAIVSHVRRPTCLSRHKKSSRSAVFYRSAPADFYCATPKSKPRPAARSCFQPDQ